jgi:hypothetical protein
MSCSDVEEHGGPYEVVQALRSYDNDWIGLDWHDYLIKLRTPGKYYQVGDVFRPRRLEMTGVQYRCTVAGIHPRRRISESALAEAGRIDAH